MGQVTWPRPFKGRFVIFRLGLAMFNPHIKYESSTITCNKEMKGNAKCKNSHFKPPFWGLRGNAHGYSYCKPFKCDFYPCDAMLAPY